MKTITFSAALADADAILTTLASDVAIQTLTTTELDGVVGTDRMVLPRSLTVDVAAAAGSYVADSTVVVTGLDHDGRTVSETFTILGTDGTETLVGTKGFQSVSQVVIAAQEDASGAFTVGIRDIVPNPACLPKGFRIGVAGTLKLGYRDGSSDKIVGLVANTSMRCDPSVIYGDSDTTATGITLFMPEDGSEI